MSAIKKVFPHYLTLRTSNDLAIFSGVTEGGSTSISCGNMVRAERGLKEIGLDLTPEFEEIEHTLSISPIPREKWRPLTQHMFDEAQKMGYNPAPTPKVDDLQKCVGCGFCELGCFTGAKWDSRRLYNDFLGKNIVLRTGAKVKEVVVEGKKAKSVIVSNGRLSEKFDADVIVLAAGGVGTAQILKSSNLPARDNLWIDVVLTVGGILKNARMLNEPPMVWFAKEENYILSPYFDILSYWFHKPWKNVPLENRVGMMIKLADTEQGTVNADGTVSKSLTDQDRKTLEEAKVKAKAIMEASGVESPFVDGLIHGGHLGGTVPLTKKDVSTMHPDWLPENLWVADLSLLPRSQGLPTMLTAAALALRVSRRISEAKTMN